MSVIDWSNSILLFYFGVLVKKLIYIHPEDTTIYQSIHCKEMHFKYLD